MRAKIPAFERVDFVLLAMFQPVQESVPVSRLHRDPIPARAHVDVPVIRRQGCERLDFGPQRIGLRHVHGMIAFADVERSAVGRHALEDRGDHRVGVGIAVAVRVGAQIIGQKITAHLEERGDGLAMVASDPRREILRSLDAAGRGLNRQSGKRNRRARTARIGIEDLVVSENALRRIGILDVCIADVGCGGNGVRVRRHARELEVDGEGGALFDVDGAPDFREFRGAGD